MRIRPLPAVFVALFALTAILAPVAAGPLTPELLVDLHSVADAALSPDGGRIAYLLEVPRAADDEPGSSYRELWLAAVDGSPRRFAGHEERIAHPRWSPDGTRIAFLSDRGEGDDTELFVMPADGGEARRMFEHDGSIATFEWAPGGDAIAFTARDPKPETDEEAEKAGRDWIVADEKPRFRRLWRYDLDSGETTRWTEGALDVWALDWAPDGASIVIFAADSPRIDDEYMFSTIYRVPRGGAPVELVDTPGKLANPAVSPDGRTLAYHAAISTNDPLAQSLFVAPLTGGAARNLTPGFEGSVAISRWWDERRILMIAVERERQVPYLVDATSGERRALDWPRLIANAIDGDNGRFAVVAHAPNHPAELFVLDGEAAPRRLTTSNPALADVELARQEVVRWRAKDGTSISGVLTYPLEYSSGTRYPLVLQIHGGPEGVSLDGWTSRAGYPVQPLAAAGFVVLQPNYRGSQGRGVAFSQADHDDLGGAEFDDVLAGIDTLVERGIVDRERVGTGGWSYGGYFSAWAATRHSELFKASVVAAGLTNWIAFAGTTDIPHEMSLVHWNSYWYDEPELHWERSPLAHLNRAKTPTLIVHGANDDRVHPEQSLELYTGLRLKQVPAQYVLYPREPHGLNERAHRLDFVERVLAWFDLYLGTRAE